MRRVLGVLFVLVLIAGAGAGGYIYGTQQGASGGFQTAAADRAAFAATPRAGGSPVSVGMGSVGSPGASGGMTGPGVAGGAMGSVVSSTGAPSGVGAPGAGMAGAGGRGMGAAGMGMGAGSMGTPGAGSPGAGRMTGVVAANVTGKVARIDGPMLVVEGPNNSVVSVATSGSTLFTKLVTGTMADLKVNDFVAVQGDRANESTVTARTITTTSPQNLAGNPGAGLPGAVGGTPAAMRPGGAGGVGMSGMGMGSGGDLVGRITQMDGAILTLTTLNNMTITVNTTATTKVQSTQTTSLQEIRAGDTLIVVGERTGDNAVSARLVTNQGAGG